MSGKKIPNGLTAFKVKGKGDKGMAAVSDMADAAAHKGNVKKAKLKVKFSK